MNSISSCHFSMLSKKEMLNVLFYLSDADLKIVACVSKQFKAIAELYFANKYRVESLLEKDCIRKHAIIKQAFPNLQEFKFFKRDYCAVISQTNELCIYDFGKSEKKHTPSTVLHPPNRNLDFRISSIIARGEKNLIATYWQTSYPSEGMNGTHFHVFSYNQKDGTLNKVLKEEGRGLLFTDDRILIWWAGWNCKGFKMYNFDGIEQKQIEIASYSNIKKVSIHHNAICMSIGADSYFFDLKGNPKENSIWCNSRILASS